MLMQHRWGSWRLGLLLVCAWLLAFYCVKQMKEGEKGEFAKLGVESC